MAKAKTTVSFQKVLGEAIHAHMEAEMERQRKQEELRAAEKSKEERGKHLVRLQRLAYFAGFNNCPLDWRAREWAPNQFWNDYEWKEVHELETAELSMSVTLQESKKHKKFKYNVEVRAWRTQLSGKPGEIHGGYRSTNYGKDTYMKRIEYGKYEEIPGQEMDKSFTKLEDARDFAKMWMGRLYNDHLEEIAADREIYEAAKAAGLVFDQHARRSSEGNIVPFAERTKH